MDILQIMTSIPNENTQNSGDRPDIKDTPKQSKPYERRFLASYPDPTGPTTLTLIDELGNGGLHSKLRTAPIESYHIHNGPTLPVVLSRER